MLFISFRPQCVNEVETMPSTQQNNIVDNTRGPIFRLDVSLDFLRFHMVFKAFNNQLSL